MAKYITHLVNVYRFNEDYYLYSEFDVSFYFEYTRIPI